MRPVVLVSGLSSALGAAALLLLACNHGASGEAADSGTNGDEAPDEASGGDDATASIVTIESPADSAPPGDGAALPPACAEYDAGAPAYASPAGGTVVGTGVSATVCAATAVDVSAYLSPANRLLLRIDGAVFTTFEAPANATQGTLALMISVGTDTPAVYTSAEPQSCGFAAFTYELPVAPGEVTYLASATSDCVDPTVVSGSWAVTLTSVTPYEGTAGPGKYYVAHGMLAATLPQSNGGPGTVTVALAF
ncbi:MAG TPA: hypothetical protein VGL81_01680 [Polyangiaceae bacterium]|jgi:hypothetical protein